MKYLCILLIVASTSRFCTCYERTTGEVAATEQYPLFITDYRNKAEKFFNSVIVETALRIQELQSRDLFHRAESLQSFYEGEYERMQDTFDTFFRNFDEEYLVNAKKLDAEEAPEKIKAAFIAALKNKVAVALSTLLDFYSKKFNVLDKVEKR